VFAFAVLCEAKIAVSLAMVDAQLEATPGLPRTNLGFEGLEVLKTL
jgi:hypothetical protein